MNNVLRYLLLAIFPILVAGSCEGEKGGVAPPPPVISIDPDVEVQVYLSKPDGSVKFQFQEGLVREVSDSSLLAIEVNTNMSYQEIDGFGFSLTGGSAKLLSSMSNSGRVDILEELFDVNEGAIGTSYLRLSLGSSDLDEYTFSYNDTPGDVAMDNFDLGYDRKYLIPNLKRIQSINPEINLMASPWSAPSWMKTNNATIGGRLKTEYYEAYALYFVKYIQQMQAEGIIIDAVTVQNEPLHGGNNPSMEMSAEEQLVFVKNDLGPAFEKANISTKIVIYDHNCDKPEYPLTILNNAAANKYVDGTAFHLYAGDISALSTVHNAHPDKALYFTEQWVGAPGNFSEDIKWHTREVVIGSTRNWSKVALEWNLASDPVLGPHTDGGCDECLGAITIDGNRVVRNPSFYTIAHIAKYVRPGSVRVSSNYESDLPNVAFLTPDDKVVVLVLNDTDAQKIFNINVNAISFNTELKSGEVATYVVDL